MKTSNKILLSTLLAIFLILIGIHVALYAKYKSGDYTIAEDVSSSTDTTALKPFRFVSATGMDNLVILPSTSFSIATAKKMPDYFKYVIKGDTLLITGDTASYKNDEVLERRRMPETVYLHVPQVEMILAENCSVHLVGSTDSINAINTKINLTNSSLLVQDLPTERPRYFGNLIVTASAQSEVMFADNPSTSLSVSCQLRNSRLQDSPSASIGSLNVQADQQSTVQLNGNNISKLASQKQ